MNAWRYLDRANLVTLGGLVAGLGCALLAVSGRQSAAVGLLMMAGLCDLFDGYLARGTRRDATQKLFGARLDSLVEVCSFGFAPAVLLYAAGARSLPEVAILVFYLLCVAWRVALFDTLVSDGDWDQGRFYVGLPCTYVALVLPAFFAVGAIAPRAMTPRVLRFTLDAAATGLAFLMISRRRIPKPGGRWYIIFLLVAMGIAGALVLSEPIVPVAQP